MFQIDLMSRKPIYEQIVDEVKKLIINEVLEADARLPSVREMSRQMALNPNTVQRAYRELEAQGYIYSVKGRGSFVASSDHRSLDGTQKTALVERLNAMIREMRDLGIEDATIREAVENQLRHNRGENNDED